MVTIEPWFIIVDHGWQNLPFAPWAFGYGGLGKPASSRVDFPAIAKPSPQTKGSRSALWSIMNGRRTWASPMSDSYVSQNLLILHPWSSCDDWPGKWLIQHAMTYNNMKPADGSHCFTHFSRLCNFHHPFCSRAAPDSWSEDHHPTGATSPPSRCSMAMFATLLWSCHLELSWGRGCSSRGAPQKHLRNGYGMLWVKLLTGNNGG